jgi:hypothetical protein
MSLNKKMNNKLLRLSLMSVFAVIISLTLNADKVHAASYYDLSGWAWSSNIGWVSFNSADSGAGGGPYKVRLSQTGTTFKFQDYAWSPNIGWISFNSADTLGCPSASNAVLSTTTGDVMGTIRAVTAMGRTDGWDGCIELSGTNHATRDFTGNGGVTFDNRDNYIKGYAWGGDVMGWLQFVNVSCPTCTSAQQQQQQQTQVLRTQCDVTKNVNTNTVDVTYNLFTPDGIPNYNYNINYGDSSTNGSATVNTSNKTFAHSYIRQANDSTVNPQYRITDGSSPSKDSQMQGCGAVTVDGTNPIVPGDSYGVKIYFKNEKPIIPSGKTADQVYNSIPTKRIRLGSDVSISIENGGSTLMNCTGIFIKTKTGSTVPSGYESYATDFTSPNNGSGLEVSNGTVIDYRFTHLVKGIYAFNMTCKDLTDPNNPVIKNTNPLSFSVSDAFQSEK